MSFASSVGTCKGLVAIETNGRGNPYAVVESSPSRDLPSAGTPAETKFESAFPRIRLGLGERRAYLGKRAWNLQDDFTN